VYTQVLNFTCSLTNHVICVSHTSKENTVLRANIAPADVSVIPNAVDTTMFTPNPAARKSNCITIVCITRLVYRKGVDLMVEIIPLICKQYDHVNFVIGGDGPMRVALDQMRENHQLQDRVEMLGQVPHTQVRNVLVRGHIYLNCSLTEAFCIAILEAASCGLLVVSTKVGGVPEVMPHHMIKYAPPDGRELTRVLARAIVKDVKDVVPQEFHERVRRMYSWQDVAMRTCKVYDKVARDEAKPILHRIHVTMTRGPVFGILLSLLVAIDFLVWRVLCYLFPAEDVEMAEDYARYPDAKARDQGPLPSRNPEATTTTTKSQPHYVGDTTSGGNLSGSHSLYGKDEGADEKEDGEAVLLQGHGGRGETSAQSRAHESAGNTNTSRHSWHAQTASQTTTSSHAEPGSVEATGGEEGNGDRGQEVQRRDHGREEGNRRGRTGADFRQFLGPLANGNAF
jgi:hypothetical protein